MTEAPEVRLKRLRLRSWRRGIREMDLILGTWADRRLAGLGEADLSVYETLLEENDHDLYRWVVGAEDPPQRLAALIAAIAADTGGDFPATAGP